MPDFENKKQDEGSNKEMDNVLRARDIIPPFNDEAEGAEKRGGNVSESKNKQDTVPSFDLAEEIMAEQRKFTSIRRKSPVQKIEPLRGKNGYKIEEAISSQRIDVKENAEMDRIVSEIVARDIEKLCMMGKI